MGTLIIGIVGLVILIAFCVMAYGLIKEYRKAKAEINRDLEALRQAVCEIVRNDCGILDSRRKRVKELEERMINFEFVRKHFEIVRKDELGED